MDAQHPNQHKTQEELENLLSSFLTYFQQIREKTRKIAKKYQNPIFYRINVDTSTLEDITIQKLDEPGLRQILDDFNILLDSLLNHYEALNIQHNNTLRTLPYMRNQVKAIAKKVANPSTLQQIEEEKREAEENDLDELLDEIFQLIDAIKVELSTH